MLRRRPVASPRAMPRAATRPWRWTIGAAAVTAVAWGAAAPSAVAALPFAVGIGEQSSDVFDDPRFTALDVDHVRVVVPFDLLDDDALGADARAFLERAARQGRRVQVALEHARGVDCRKVAPCPAPTVAEYRRAFAGLVARYPWVDSWVPWNEPNHASQPTFRDPSLAAAYFTAAREACGSCTLVAGDLLDDSRLADFWRAYAAGLPERPAVVGLHNYHDATYFSSTGVDTMLELAPHADVWLTEVGGIVRFDSGSGSGLAHDEARAADAVRWTLALPLDRPRVRRVYLYRWSSDSRTHFDAGLIGPSGQARPAYQVLADAVGVRAEATSEERAAVAAAASGAPGGPSSTAEPVRSRAGLAAAPPRLRVADRSAVLRGRRLEVALACPAVVACRGSLRLLGRRAAVVVRPQSRRTAVVRLGPRGLRAVRARRHVGIRLCAAGVGCSRVRVSVTVVRPDRGRRSVTTRPTRASPTAEPRRAP